jgi:hypothetical protein
MGLSTEQIIEYQTTGCLIAPDIFSPDDLHLLIDELTGAIDERATRMKEAGKISDAYETEPFDRRFASLCRECPEIGVRFDIMFLLGREMFALLRHERFLDAVECLLGSEITCNPVQHLRAKMPEGAEWRSVSEDVPWHQDAQVNRAGEGLRADIITCWIPLVDATMERGAMEVIPDAFKFGLLNHIDESDKLGPSISDSRIADADAQPAPCPKGGVVFLNKYTPHRGTPNRTDIVRWSLDLRYQRTGSPSGRPNHPDFIVRSRRDPTSVYTDYEEWRQRWIEGLKAKPFAREKTKTLTAPATNA